MNIPVNNTEQSGVSHLGVFQNCFNKLEDGYETQNLAQNYFVNSNQVNFDSYSYERYDNYIEPPDAYHSSSATNYKLYSNDAHQHPPTSNNHIPVLQGSEGTDPWTTSFHGFTEERLGDAIGVLQKHAESCNDSHQIDYHVPTFSNASQSITFNATPSCTQPHVLNSSKEEDFKTVKAIRKKKTNRKKEPKNNKKSASGYAHFFRERQARIKEENKSASFGEISKIVASEWEALTIDEKAVYKRKAENAKNDQFKEIALTHAMTVAGANLSNNNDDNQIVIDSKAVPIGQNIVQGNIASITYQHSQQQQQQAHLIHHTHQQQQHLEVNYNHGQMNYQKIKKSLGPDFLDPSDLGYGYLKDTYKPKCYLCDFPISSGRDEKCITCNKCNLKVHRRCLIPNDNDKLNISEEDWQCEKCTAVCSLCKLNNEAEPTIHCTICDTPYHVICIQLYSDQPKIGQQRT